MGEERDEVSEGKRRERDELATNKTKWVGRGEKVNL